MNARTQIFTAAVASMVCLSIAAISGQALAAPDTTEVVYLPAKDKPTEQTTFFTGPRIAATIMATSGLAALIVGAVHSSRADDLTAQSQEYCLYTDPDRCKPKGYELRALASSEGRIGSTALGVGTAAIVLSITLAWINPDFHARKRSSSVRTGETTTIRFVPVIASTQRGFVLSGSF